MNNLALEEPSQAARSRSGWLHYVSAVLAGTIDLADTLWSTLTADNFV